MRSITTSTGELKIVTFKEFIKCIPAKEVESNVDVYRFNTMIDQERVTNEERLLSNTASYVRNSIILMEGNREYVLRAHLFFQAFKKYIFKRDLHSIAETLSVKYLMKFGNPTHLVRLDNRIWIAANPEDYLIVYNALEVGLACLFSGRNIAYNIDRTTEDHVMDEALKISPNMNKDKFLQIIRGLND